MALREKAITVGEGTIWLRGAVGSKNARTARRRASRFIVVPPRTSALDRHFVQLCHALSDTKGAEH